MHQLAQKKWTIGFVNYKTSIYMKWQFKCLYEFNNPQDFTIVIVDNSRDAQEKAALEALVAPYNKKYNNIILVIHQPVEKTASGQHGEGLTLILKEYTNSEYILFQDPDFFWVKKNILNWFESFFKQGKVAIGSPYPGKVGEGHPYFPCVYGCAHRVSDIKHLDLFADASDEARERGARLFPYAKGYCFSYDVAWKLRKELSTPDDDTNFISLEDKIALEINETFGRHSFETITRKYLYQGRVVAYHLFRGSFTGAVTETHQDPQALTPAEWLVAREKFGNFFYETLNRDGRPQFKFKKFLIRKAIHHVLFRGNISSMMVRSMTQFLKKSKYGFVIIRYLKKGLGLA